MRILLTLISLLAVVSPVRPGYCAAPALADLAGAGEPAAVAAPSAGIPARAGLAQERPFLASLRSILLFPNTRPKVEEELTLEPQRSGIPRYGSRNQLKYTARLQPGKTAPLLFIIPGVGGYATNGTTLFLSELAYSAGYSVVTLPSSTHWSFALAASRTGKIGYLPDDAKDMHRLLRAVKGELESEHGIRPARYGVAGYSYGGLDAGFVAAEDLAEKTFDFSFVLAINPPLSRALAIEKIDKYFASGARWSAGQRSGIISYAVGTVVEISGKHAEGGPISSLENLQSRFRLSERQIAWAMAVTFGNTLKDTVTAANVIEGKPPLPPGPMPVTLTEYLRTQVYPDLARKQNRSVDELLADSELSAVLSKHSVLNDRFVLFHSTDDFLSFPEGRAMLDSMNVEKHVGSTGGHLGALAEKETQEELVRTLEALKSR